MRRRYTAGFERRPTDFVERCDNCFAELRPNQVGLCTQCAARKDHPTSPFGNSQEPCGISPSRTVEACAPPSQNGRTCGICGKGVWA